MPFVYGDRVKETSTSVGVGNFTLDGAVGGFRSFASGIGNGNQCYYAIENDADTSWEVGIGTLIASNTFQRDTVLTSSNSNLPVAFAAGIKFVGATVTSQFFTGALLTVNHASLNHSGLPGVPAPEAFTSAAHALVDHTSAPFNLLDQGAHALINHLAPPLSLLDAPTHALIDHTGLPGVGQGTLVNASSVEISAVATSGSLMPYDDTVPQISEGTQFMSLVHTPLDAANLLRVSVVWNGTHSSSSALITAALFNGASNALVAGGREVTGSVNSVLQIVLSHQLVAGGVAPITFTVRAGANLAGTTTFNGAGGTRRYGGVAYSSIHILEFEP